MSSREHFVWAFVLVTIIVAVSLVFAMWLVLRLA
jgi:hypothetical protein